MTGRAAFRPHSIHGIVTELRHASISTQRYVNRCNQKSTTHVPFYMHERFRLRVLRHHARLGIHASLFGHFLIKSICLKHFAVR
jgi:hypothetical protein